MAKVLLVGYGYWGKIWYKTLKQSEHELVAIVDKRFTNGQFVVDPIADTEEKIEVIFPKGAENAVIRALFSSHPYEEVAYDIVTLSNDNQKVGSGMIGILQEPTDEMDFLCRLQKSFGTSIIRHSQLSGKKIQKVAVSGGSGAFLIPKAIGAGADIFVTAELK